MALRKLEQLRQCLGSADDGVHFEHHTKTLQAGYLGLDDLLRKPELGDSVHQHPARFMQGFIDSHGMSRLDQVAGTGKAGRSAPDDGDTPSGGSRLPRHTFEPLVPHVVGHVPLEVPNGDRALLLCKDTGALALVFLGANTTANGRQEVVALDDLGSGTNRAFRYQFQEGIDLDAYRAPVGVTLFEEGGSDKYLAFIVKGKVNILKENGTTSQKHIATARTGSCLGEMSIVDDFPQSATAEIVEETEVIILTKRNLLRITEESAVLGIRILWRLAWQLSARLRQTSGALAEHL